MEKKSSSSTSRSSKPFPSPRARNPLGFVCKKPVALRSTSRTTKFQTFPLKSGLSERKSDGENERGEDRSDRLQKSRFSAAPSVSGVKPKNRGKKQAGNTGKEVERSSVSPDLVKDEQKGANRPQAPPDDVYESPLSSDGSDSELGHVPRAKITKEAKGRDVTLPERYAMLVEFFEAMEAAIRLLRLRKTVSTFSNVSPQVEVMTNRRFSHSHVAQMKHILPECIILEKYMVRDESSFCMKPELKITLSEVCLKDDKAVVDLKNALSLRKVFHQRLTEFLKSHPEGTEIPEDPLPEPFNRRSLSSISSIASSVLPKQRPTTQPSVDEPVHISSLFPKSFKRHFSTKQLVDQTLNVDTMDNAARGSVSTLKPEPSVDKSIVEVSQKSKEVASQETNPLMTPFKISSSSTPQVVRVIKGTDELSFQTPSRTPVSPAVTVGNTPATDIVEPDSESRGFRTPSAKKPVHFESALSPPSSHRRVRSSSVKRAIFSGFSADCEVTEQRQLRSSKRKNTENAENEQLQSSLPATKLTKTNALGHFASAPSREGNQFIISKESPVQSPLRSPQKASFVGKSKVFSLPKSDIATPPLTTPKKASKANESPSPQVKSGNEVFSQECVAQHSKKQENTLKGPGSEVDLDPKDSLKIEQTSRCDGDIVGIVSPELVKEIQQREQKVLEELSSGVPAAKRRQQMLGYLPKLFNVVRDIYRSSRRSVLTRQELMQKIVSFHTDVVDKAEVEEQFRLLEEFASEWISGKVASTGDVLYSVRSNVDFKRIHERLARAV